MENPKKIVREPSTSPRNAGEADMAKNASVAIR